MVKAVNAGHIWEWARLSCLRWHFFWESASWRGVGWGVNPGRSGSSRSFCHTLDAAGVVGGGVAGAEPPHKGGPNRPDRPEMQFLVFSFQFLVVRGQFCACAGSELIMRLWGSAAT